MFGKVKLEYAQKERQPDPRDHTYSTAIVHNPAPGLTNESALPAGHKRRLGAENDSNFRARPAAIHAPGNTGLIRSQ